jgi:hypothetical protein
MVSFSGLSRCLEAMVRVIHARVEHHDLDSNLHLAYHYSASSG